MKESALQTKALKYLRGRGAYVENIWGGGFQSAGIPDIVGCYRGRFIAFELKVGKNKPSEIQKAKLNMINEAEGFGILVYDTLDDIVETLDLIDLQIELEDN